jgi:hypothetical protein
MRSDLTCWIGGVNEVERWTATLTSLEARDHWAGPHNGTRFLGLSHVAAYLNRNAAARTLACVYWGSP